MKAIKKIMVAVLLSLSMVVSFVPMNVFAAEAVDIWDGSIATEFAGGTGQESNPYQIASGSQLAYLASMVNKGEGYENTYFVLTADIDLNNISWTPIGNSLFVNPEYIFEGNFDGQEHSISNLTIGTKSSTFESDVVGLFGATAGKICNLALNNVSINGMAKSISNYIYESVGALAGYSGGSIENCHAVNVVINMNISETNRLAAYWIGGLVGILDSNQYIKECSVMGKITEKSGKGSIGGLIGELAEESEVSYSRADTKLDVVSDYYGGARVGGFIGKGNGNRNEKTVISNCYATGSVTGGSYSGGFAGNLSGLNIKNCYASGNVTGASNAMATFVGTDGAAYNDYGSIKNCYTTGKILGTSTNTYAFAMQDAMERSKISNCYFINENVKSKYESAIAKSLEEMKVKDFTDLLNDGDNSNGWIYIENQLPLCGAEPADYTKVNEAKAKVPSDLSLYTEETVKALKDTLVLVEEGKNIAEQTTVDGYADAINKAISELKYKDADYTKVNEAKAKVPSDLSIYTDETVKALKDALALVEEGKNVTEQTTVDGYADAINKAIEGLVKKNISYKVIEGEGEIFVKESGKDISIRIDHEYTENVKVEVDDQEVDKVHYKVTKGSTIITFDDMYLNTLAVGTHHVKVTFEDGIATTTLVIKEQTKDDNKKNDSTSNNQETVKSVVKAENKQEVKKVKTGDDENIIGIALLLLGSLVVLTYIRKKKID